MSDDEYLISVIVPIYNCSKYITGCTGGILHCGVERLQLILIDDGSTDDGGAICDDIADSDNRVTVVHTDRRGPSAARNTGIELAKGEYISFVDSDDYIDGDAFARTVDKLPCIHPDLLAVDFYCVADDGTRINSRHQIRKTQEPITDDSYKAEFLSARDAVWNVWRYIYRREYIARLGLRFAEGIDWGEDVEFSVRALMGTRNTAYYHNPYYHYRLNYGASLSQRFSARRASQLMKMLASAYNVAAASDTPDARLLEGKLSREYVLNLSMYKEAPKGERSEILMTFRENRYLMNGARGIYVPITKCISIFGIPGAALVLHLMKKASHHLRNIKRRMKGHRR